MKYNNKTPIKCDRFLICDFFKNYNVFKDKTSLLINIEQSEDITSVSAKFSNCILVFSIGYSNL